MDEGKWDAQADDGIQLIASKTGSCGKIAILL